jgi:hypothetical protein
MEGIHGASIIFGEENEAGNFVEVVADELP